MTRRTAGPRSRVAAAAAGRAGPLTARWRSSSPRVHLPSRRLPRGGSRRRMRASVGRLPVCSAVASGAGACRRRRRASDARYVLADVTNLRGHGVAGVLTLLGRLSAWLYRRGDAGSAARGDARAGPARACARFVPRCWSALELPTTGRPRRTGLGLLVLGALVWAGRVAVRCPGDSACRRGRERALPTRRRGHDARAVRVALSGAAVGAVGASWACQGVSLTATGSARCHSGATRWRTCSCITACCRTSCSGSLLWLAVEAYRTQRAAGADRRQRSRSSARRWSTPASAPLSVSSRRTGPDAGAAHYGSQRAGVVGRGDPAS